MTAPFDVKIELDPKDLKRFLAGLKRFDPKLATATRRRLRQAGDEAVKAMQEAILSLPADRQYGVRQAIADGIKTQVMTGKRSNGVRISGSGSRLPAARKAMLKALNLEKFRHPLFARRDVWFEQQGKPYFGAVLYGHYRNVMYDAIQDALEDAVKAVEAST